MNTNSLQDPHSAGKGRRRYGELANIVRRAARAGAASTFFMFCLDFASCTGSIALVRTCAHAWLISSHMKEEKEDGALAYEQSMIPQANQVIRSFQRFLVQ